MVSTSIDAGATPATAAPAAEERLPVGLKVGWATGALGVALLMNTVAALALFYFTTVVGIAGWIAGVLLMISKLYDAFTDPMAGIMSDNTKSKQGRRRPYLLWGAVISAASIVMLFSVPFEGDTLLAWAYVLVALILLSTGYSVYNVPYMAMPAEMTDGYHERSAIHGWRVMMAAIGSSIAATGSGILLSILSGGEKGPDGRTVNEPADYMILSLLYGAIILVTMLIAWRTTRSARRFERSEKPLPWRSQVTGFLGNKPFLVILSVKAVQLFGIAASQSATFFLIVQVLRRSPADLAWLGLPLVISSLAVTPMLVALSKRIGKRGGYILAAVSTGLVALSWMLAQPDDPVWTLVARGVLTGVGFSGNVLFAMSMLTDAMELDAHRTGMRREGSYTAVYSFVEKFSMAVGPAIVGAALSIAGFDRTATITPENAEAVRQATLLGVAYIPAGCAVVAVLLLTFYRLSAADLQAARTKGLTAFGEDQAFENAERPV